MPQVIARLRTRVVSKTSQGCDTCNRTAQHPVVKRLAVSYRHVPLMVFKVGQVNSGQGSLALREVLYTPLQEAPGGKETLKRLI